MAGEDRINEIIKIIRNIQESKQPVKKYFENNFPNSQHFRDYDIKSSE